MEAIKKESQPLLLTVPEACDVLNIGRSRLLKEIAAGRIPVIRFGRAVRISRQALEKFIESQQAS